MDVYSVLFGNCLANGRTNCGYIQIQNKIPFHLLNNEQFLSALLCHSHGRTASLRQSHMAIGYRFFDVLGVMILSSDNNQILLAAGDIQMTLAEEPEVSCAKEGPISSVSEKRVKSLFCMSRLVPITAGNI